MTDEQEDATVEVESDAADPSFDDSSPGVEPQPSLVNYAVQSGLEFVQLYGWYIVILAITLCFLLRRRRNHTAQYGSANQIQTGSQADRVDERNASVHERHIEAMLLARARQQEENEKRIAEFREAQQRKQAERDADQIAEYERVFGNAEGQRLGGSSSSGTSSTKPSGSQPSGPTSRLRPDGYMPLGGTSGATYRPGGGRCRPGARSS